MARNNLVKILVIVLIVSQTAFTLDYKLLNKIDKSKLDIREKMYVPEEMDQHTNKIEESLSKIDIRQKRYVAAEILQSTIKIEENISNADQSKNDIREKQSVPAEMNQNKIKVEENLSKIDKSKIYTKIKRSVPVDKDQSTIRIEENMSQIDKSQIDIREKRSVPIEMVQNTTNFEENNSKIEVVETCIGAEEYCNLTREDYVEMLTNYIYPQPYEWVLIVTHSLVFIIGLIGNALVCVAVYRNHTMRTVTNYFIVNLAVADFMVILICLPPTVLWDVTETWFFGTALCKIILYFQSVSVTVSVLTLTFISVDRWYAICFPLRFKSTTGRAKIAIIVIWAVSLTFNAPDVVVLTTEKLVPLRFDLEYLVQCVPTWSPRSELVWHILKLLFIYTIPLLLMTVAYYQIVKVLWRSEKIPGQAETAKLAPAEKIQLNSRRKAAKMLAAVVIMFAVCYFPVNLLSMLRCLVDMEQSDGVTFLALVSHVLCYANSAINPLIYNFMNGKFRREFRRAFCCSNPMPENLTTLTRLTTGSKKKYEVTSMKNRRPTHSTYTNNNCNTAFF